MKKSYERGHRSGPRFPPGVPTRSPNFAVASRARPPRRIQFDMFCSHLLCRAEGTSFNGGTCIQRGSGGSEMVQQCVLHTFAVAQLPWKNLEYFHILFHIHSVRSLGYSGIDEYNTLVISHLWTSPGWRNWQTQRT
jgi:hypothetical protein